MRTPPATAAPTSELRNSVTPAVGRRPPRYSDFIRKETRLRAEQIDDLAILARRLNRSRAPGLPRITENTLIRVAVDALLINQAVLAGNNEDELRRSAQR